MRIISGSSHSQLAIDVARQLGVEMIQVESTQFDNGERRIWVKDNVNGDDVLIIQSFSNPVDENIIEFLMLTDAIERMGARSIYAVIPWMGYSLQDKVFRPGEPIAAKVIADLVSNAFTKRVFLFDLHNTSIPGFFSVPTVHLSANGLMIDYVKSHLDLKNAVVASPDFGGLKRSREFAVSLGLNLININKVRDRQSGRVTVVDLQGEVQGKDIIMFDDCILSGQTVIRTAKLLKKEGAKNIYFFATHGVFTNDALEKIGNSLIKEIIITDSIHHLNLPSNVKTLSIAPIIAKTLRAWKK